MTTILQQYIDLIESTDTEKEICCIKHKRYSTTGGHYIKETRIHHKHQIKETFKYLKNWYTNIDEILFFNKMSNIPTAIYSPRTEIKLVSEDKRSSCGGQNG